MSALQGKLQGKVAVVTGASRGAGRGIAHALGAEGATVFVTGRSVRGAGTTEGLPGTVDEVAEEVTGRGGRGIAVRCDHREEEQVAALFARVQRDAGHLDILVSNAWGGYEAYDGAAFVAPFWEQRQGPWPAMFDGGVRAHLLSCSYAAPLLIAQKGGLIALTTAADRNLYLGALVYDLAKNAVVRMALGMGRELRPHGVAAVALALGFLRTERTLAHGIEDLAGTESPEYAGRAVVALAGDPDVLRRSGGCFAVGELARAYGFRDVDGRQPAPFRLPWDE